MYTWLLVCVVENRGSMDRVLMFVRTFVRTCLYVLLLLLLLMNKGNI